LSVTMQQAVHPESKRSRMDRHATVAGSRRVDV